MLTPISPSAPRQAPADLVDLLLDCHRRIRRFVAVARHLADAEAVTDAEAAEAAEAIARYFSVALPLHVRDEDESILPRLRGRNDEVDAALDAMNRQHRDHEAHVVHLTALCRHIAAAPVERPALRAELSAVVAELDSAFAHHLAQEETIIFPAIRKLIDPLKQAAIVAELRARRAVQ